MRLSIARAIDIKAQCGFPAGRIGCKLPVAQRHVALRPRQADTKIVRTPHAKRQRLREVSDGVAYAHMRNQRESIARANWTFTRGECVRHCVEPTLPGVPGRSGNRCGLRLGLSSRVPVAGVNGRAAARVDNPDVHRLR